MGSLDTAMEILHLSHHQGCLLDFEAVGERLGFEVVSANFDDGYNIGPARAAKAWERWKSRLNGADAVLVSDTAPLARIVLQHLDEFRGHLVVWVCNRFDYADQATNDCGFPDPGYYELLRRVRSDPAVQNVHFASYTPFEVAYARERGVDLGRRVIKPLGLGRLRGIESPVPADVEPASTVLVPPYHNDRLLDVSSRLQELGVDAYCGRYGGSTDAARFKAVVHVPYAWSTFALFEHLQNGTPVFVPSQSFFSELTQVPEFFFADPRPDLLPMSEWYSPEHAFIVRFESWQDLADQLQNRDLDTARAEMQAAARRHTHETLEAWDRLFARLRPGSSRAHTVLGSSVRLVAERLDRYRPYLEAHAPRTASLHMAFSHFARSEGRVVVELGTIRSFVHGGLEGCNSDDVTWWRPTEPESWDWGAGCFSLLAAICLGPLQAEIHTVDVSRAHLDRCRVVTAAYSHLFDYHVGDSVDFLRSLEPGSVDLLYLDTGDMWPLEPVALHQLEEARALVECRVLSPDGLVMIDDVGNSTPAEHGDKSPFAKAKYSLPFLLGSGFRTVFDGYQVILRPPADPAAPSPTADRSS